MVNPRLLLNIDKAFIYKARGINPDFKIETGDFSE
jgi:hypothetical protein